MHTFIDILQKAQMKKKWTGGSWVQEDTKVSCALQLGRRSEPYCYGLHWCRKYWLCLSGDIHLSMCLVSFTKKHHLPLKSAIL